MICENIFLGLYFHNNFKKYIYIYIVCGIKLPCKALQIEHCVTNLNYLEMATKVNIPIKIDLLEIILKFG